jgi:pimeloyl-ACP methyl ester carboxylesterase
MALLAGGYLVIFLLAITFRALRGLSVLVASLFRDRSATVETDWLQNPSHIVILIHGTWARDAAWTLPHSALRRAFVEVLGERVLFTRLIWSGSNTFQSRATASIKLNEKIARLREQFPGRSVTLVGHSHGGNIALSAINTSLQRNVDAVICLSTPFLNAERRELGNMGRFASWGVPMFLCWVLGMFCIHRSFKHESDFMNFAVFILASALGLGMQRYIEAQADRIIAALDYRIGSFRNLLIIRTTGDEASSGLNAASFLSAAVGRIYRTVADELFKTNEILNELRARKSLIIGTSTGAAVLGIMIGLSGPQTRTTNLAAVILLVLPIISISLYLRGGAAILLGRYFLFAVALIPLALILAVFALPMGPGPAFSSLLVDVSAEVSPIGSYQVVTVSSSSSSNLDDRSLKHSRIYHAPAALEVLRLWLAEHLSPKASQV